MVASTGDDPTSLSYISYLERYATIQPATNDEAIEAAINMPLVVGDRVDTAREAEHRSRSRKSATSNCKRFHLSCRLGEVISSLACTGPKPTECKPQKRSTG